MKLIVCKGYRILCFKNNFVDCPERVRCYWSYGLGLGLGLKPCGLVNITGPKSRLMHLLIDGNDTVPTFTLAWRTCALSADEVVES